MQQRVSTVPSISTIVPRQVVSFEDETRRFLWLPGMGPLRAFRHVVNQFELDISQKGVSRMKSNIRERGAFPPNVALHLLGFGFSL
jgi:hypothetical protein